MWVSEWSVYVCLFVTNLIFSDLGAFTLKDDNLLEILLFSKSKYFHFHFQKIYLQSVCFSFIRCSKDEVSIHDD